MPGRNFKRAIVTFSVAFLLVPAALTFNFVGSAAYAVERAVMGAIDEQLPTASEREALARANRLVARKAVPAVVHIVTTTRREVDLPPVDEIPERLEALPGWDRLSEEQKREMRREQREELQRRGSRRFRGQGSGVIIDAQQGFILTKYHLAAEADNIEVRLNDGRRFEATLVGKDRATDLAVVKIEAEQLFELAIGDSETLQVGDPVLTIGNPFGNFSGSVSKGIVSDLDNEGFIQTDAVMNPGNFGGPLVNMRAEIVGICAAIRSTTGAFNGIGLAIPSSRFEHVLPSLMRGEKVVRGHLGVMVRSVSDAPGGSAAVESNPRRTPVVEVFEKAHGAVVNISSTKIAQVLRSPSPLDRRPTRKYRTTNLGSGFIIHETGYIVTNAHVVDRITDVKITFDDSTSYGAQIVAIDPDHDLAVLKVDTPRRLPVIKFGDSADLRIGATVIAIGNPLGYRHTLTTGVVSATKRDLELIHHETGQPMIYTDLIQTDASINPGGLGGPLLNVLGELIGINTATHSDAQNIGFAIPVNTLKRILPEMIRAEQKNRFSLGLTISNERRVVAVRSDSPANRAGLKVGDIITHVDQRPIKSVLDFCLEVFEHQPGDHILFDVIRSNGTMTARVLLQEHPRPAASDLTFRYRLPRRESRYVRRIVFCDPPGCTYFIESCVCDGELQMILTNPPEYDCIGTETCEDIDRYEPDGCDAWKTVGRCR